MSLDKIPIFCITLKRTEDRTNYARELFNKMGLNVYFFYGVDGTSLNVESLNIHETIASYKGWRLRNGVIGAGMSHILLWNVLLRLGYEQALILEDDVEFINNF